MEMFVAVVGAAGVGMSVIGEIQAGQARAAQAKSAQAMAEYNAKVAEQEAKQIEARGAFEGRRQAQESERQQGRIIAALGASGTVPSTGAGLALQVEQEKESELESMLVGYETQIRAGRARSQAALDRMQGDIYGQRAKSASSAGFFSAGSTLLTGFGRIGSRFI